MDPILKKPIPANRFADLGVGVLYLFGSRAEGVAGPSSDVDIGIVLSDPKTVDRSSALYDALYDLLSDVFDLSNFRTVDIVFLDRAPLELRFDAVRHGKALYESSPEFRLDFEERTGTLYRDFKPVLESFNRAVLARI